MKYIFVGDVHGKWEAVEEALSLEGIKIFMGDLIDSYDRKYDDHEKCYELMIRAIRAGEAQCLYGNHELSYIMPAIHQCSGWNRDYNQLIAAVAGEIKECFVNWIYLNKPSAKVLITHAGVTYPLLGPNGATSLLAFLEDENKPDKYAKLHWIGIERGGRMPDGGIFWGDWSRHIPIPEVLQIMGHTRGKEIRMKGTDLKETGISYCIDCLDDTGPYKFLKLDI